MTVVATLKDGRVIAKAAFSTCRASGAGGVYTSATIADLRKVESILGYELTTTTAMNVTPQDETITNNVVGLTMYMGAGGTVTGNVIVVGF